MEEACHIQTKCVYGIRVYQFVYSTGALYTGLQNKEFKVVFFTTMYEGPRKETNE